MPIEALACSSCGATDVKEVKVDTYFCNHCEAIFKYRDPSSATMTPAFCSCGNPVQVQCNVCHSAICVSCDIATKGSRGIESPTFGYRQFADRSRVPVLFTHQVLRTIQEQHGQVNHLCLGCLNAAIPGTIKSIASGRMCENPRERIGPTLVCKGKPDSKCNCCSRSFCRSCLIRSTGADIQISTTKFVFVGRGVEPCGSWIWQGSIRLPEGVCACCSTELIGRLSQASPLRSWFGAKGARFQLDLTPPRNARGIEKYRQAWQSEAALCAAKLESTLTSLLSAECHRDSIIEPLLESGQLAHNIYMVIDNRSREQT